MAILKAKLMDEATLYRMIKRISYEIVEKNKGTDDICIVGIKSRGEIVAQMIRDNILSGEGVELPCGTVDIRFYRDDLSRETDVPVIRKADFPFEVVDKKIILVDDVLYTGRTVRAAIDAIFSAGRPRLIQLAILIDRGHRELPIRADYIGKSIPTSKSERVSVMLPPYDDAVGVDLYTADDVL